MDQYLSMYSKVVTKGYLYLLSQFNSPIIISISILLQEELCAHFR